MMVAPPPVDAVDGGGDVGILGDVTVHTQDLAAGLCAESHCSLGRFVAVSVGNQHTRARTGEGVDCRGSFGTPPSAVPEQ